MSDSNNKIVNPDTPYAGNIPGGVFPGRAILIRGVVREQHYRRFNIDLCCGHLVQGDHRDDVALHINARFDKSTSLFSKGDTQIVLNSLVNNSWMLEHRAENPLYMGKPFSLRILVLKGYYKLTLNGKLLGDFVHRVPVERIKCLYIDGAVTIESIEFQGSSAEQSPEPSAPPSEDFKAEDFYKPAVPFVHKLVNFEAPRGIQITGTPRMNGTRFEVNFLYGTEYLFHFRVDLPTRDVPQGFVVRNSTKNGNWQDEERDIPFYPFKVGHTVDINFLVKNDRTEVNVDGRALCVFNYRNGLKLKDATSVTIVGDVIIQSVRLT